MHTLVHAAFGSGRRRLILASASPRRRDILTQMGLVFEVVPSDFDESLDKEDIGGPQGYVAATSLEKARDVFARLSTEDSVVLSADTIVVADGRIVEKPTSAADAFRILSSLRGHSHTVYTAMTVMLHSSTTREVIERVFIEETLVTFGDFSDEIIQSYIDTAEPMDKAGGYGYQGFAAILVKGIHGDYYTVVGLPAHRLYCELANLVEEGHL